MNSEIEMIFGKYFRRIIRPACCAAPLLILGIVAIALQSGCLWEGRTYSLGTSRADAVHRDLGAALQIELARSGRMELEVVETKGSADSIALLQAGMLDFAVVQGGFGFDETGLQSVAQIGLEYLHIVVPKSSDIRYFRDLAGRSVASGLKGTGSGTFTDRIVEASLLEPPINLVPVSQDLVGTVTLKGNRVDAAMFVTALRREFMPLLRTGQYRLVKIPSAEALAAQLYDVETASIPRGTYGKNGAIPPQPLATLAVHTNILVRDDVPDAVVRALTEALFKHRVRRLARLPRLREEVAQKETDLALHPGAANYYRRNEPITADQFEIAGVFLAAMLAALGALRALYHWWNARRENAERQVVRGILHTLQDGIVSSQDNREALLRDAQKHWTAGLIGDEDLRLILEMLVAQNAIDCSRDFASRSELDANVAAPGRD